ncbi:Two-component transcriptional response regulator, LuxR family [hydrothermal vent metagenome]|uniref:Two-component transcriptional response regulator, LuxR family n=1 Tax=hydrothermal vent metagenome TaxID=652676 RepID=A0A3B0RNN7_9ZZZZ
MNKLKVFIADDHSIVRSGVKGLFSESVKYEVVGEAGDGLAALAGIGQHHPDIVIIDITMPELDGLLVTERIVKDYPGIKVIVFSMHQELQYAVDALRAGAKAYILKGGASDEILLAVDRVAGGQVYISSPLSEQIMSDFVGIIRGEQALDSSEALTLREKEVLKLIAEGSTNKEVAAKLFLSVSTIKSYRVNIMRKLKVNDTASLVRVALQQGLVILK